LGEDAGDVLEGAALGAGTGLGALGGLKGVNKLYPKMFSSAPKDELSMMQRAIAGLGRGSKGGGSRSLEELGRVGQGLGAGAGGGAALGAGLGAGALFGE